MTSRSTSPSCSPIPDSATEETTEDDEVGHVVDDTVDLEQPIIDAVGLELPFSPRVRAGLLQACARIAVFRLPPLNPAITTSRSIRGGPSCAACHAARRDESE